MKITGKNSAFSASKIAVFAVTALVATSSFAAERPHHGTPSGHAASGSTSRPMARADQRPARSEHQPAVVGRHEGGSARSSRPAVSGHNSGSAQGNWSSRGAVPQGQSHGAPSQTWRGGQHQGSQGHSNGNSHSPAISHPVGSYSQYSGRYGHDGQSNGNGHGSNWGNGHGSSWGNGHGSSWGNSHGSSWGNGHGSSWHGGSNNHFHGRISRLDHHHGGYYVWLDHSTYSFWVPEARFALWPLSVGLSVSFGGGWNPAGYYNVYDVGPYAYGSYGSSYGPSYGGSYGTYGGSTAVILQGVVQSFDYDRGTVVIRDATSGRFFTVLLRGDDPQFGDLVPGAYVVLSGAWGQGGAFDAYRVEDLQRR